jgi:glyoxylase-like metal-dependent hydrolase (beta-lactamase superfamily II)
MKQIEQGIYYEDSYLGVTLGALVLPHGVVMIDAPLRPEDARAWKSLLMNQRGGSNRLLVSLDAHPDRTLGTRALECTIISHQKAALVFRNRPTIFKGQSAETGAVWETYNDVIGMRWASPDITFTDRLFLNWGGTEVVLEYHPGPTPGSIWVVLPVMNVIFVGDTLTPNQPPFLAQADLNAWIESLDILSQQYSNAIVVGGRGGLVTTEDIQNQYEILNVVSQGIELLAEKNASPEAIQEVIASLISQYNTPSKLRDMFITRLHYGLQQCFARRYRPSAALGQIETEPEEE